jgi:hypothetical protein
LDLDDRLTNAAPEGGAVLITGTAQLYSPDVRV